MKRLSKVFVLFVALALTITVCSPIVEKTGVTAAADSTSINFYGALNAHTPLLAIAKENSLIYQRIGKGTTVEILSETGNYYYVKVGSLTGYLPKNRVNTFNANLISNADFKVGAGRSYRTIASLSSGTNIFVISKKTNWSYVMYNGQKGWIPNSAIRRYSISKVSTATDSVATFNVKASVRSAASSASESLTYCGVGTQVKVLSVGESWTRVQVDSKVGYVSTNYLRRGNGYVKSANTKLRGSASDTGSVLSVLYRDERITIVNQGTKWTQVIVGGVRGYILTSAIAKDKVYSISGSASATQIYTVTATVPLKSGKGSGSTLATLEKGDTVYYVSQSGSYYQVKSGTKTGYVPASKVKYGNAKILANDTPVKRVAAASGDTIRTLSQGTRVCVLSIVRSWAKIQIGEITGYVQVGLYEKDYTANTDISPDSKLLFTTKATKLYKSTSSSSGTIASLPKGTILNKVCKSSSGAFYQVVVAGRIGYVYAKDISYGNGIVRANGTQLLSSPNASSSVVRTLSRYNKITILKESGDYYYITYSGKTGYVLKPFVCKITTGYSFSTLGAKKLVINGNLYSSASTSSSVKTSISGGQSVYVIENSGDFYKVVYSNRIGYIHKDAFNPVSSGRTNADLKLYSSTDSNHSTLAYIPSGSSVSIVKDYDDNWMQIKYDGKTGYVLSTYIDRTNGSDYTWRNENGYWFAYDKAGNRVRDVSDIVSGPYKIVTYKYQCITVVYARSSDGSYNLPVKAMICSPGYGTPEGTYYSPSSFRWLQMVGDTYAQWCTDIIGSYLYHTVPDWTLNNLDLEVDEFNYLGSIRSLGCIRLLASDCKWIYDNTSAGQEIEITPYNNSPVSKPANIYVPSWHSWDPTDPTAHYKCLENGCH